MNKEEFEELINEILGRLMELCPQYNSKFVKKLYNNCITETSILEGRKTLLAILMVEVASCTSCSRNTNRINNLKYEYAFDSILILGDYPSYIDTLAGSPFTGLPEVLNSKCGKCTKLKEHFGHLFMNNLKPLNNTICNFSSVLDLNRIELPVVFTGGTDSLMPFISPGQILDRILLDLEINRKEVFITNVIQCPSFEEEGLNVSVTAAERKACKPWLELIFKVIKPKLVICLGKVAFEYFYPKDKLTTQIGKLKTLSMYPFLIGSTYHPGLVVRSVNTPRSDFYYKEIGKHINYFVEKYKEIV